VYPFLWPATLQYSTGVCSMQMIVLSVVCCHMSTRRDSCGVGAPQLPSSSTLQQVQVMSSATLATQLQQQQSSLGLLQGLLQQLAQEQQCPPMLPGIDCHPSSGTITESCSDGSAAAACSAAGLAQLSASPLPPTTALPPPVLLWQLGVPRLVWCGPPARPAGTSPSVLSALKQQAAIAVAVGTTGSPLGLIQYHQQQNAAAMLLQQQLAMSYS